MAMAPLTIRMATPEDIPVLHTLYTSEDGHELLSLSTVQDLFAAIACIPHYHIYLLLREEEAVGTFSLLFAPTMMYPGFHKYAILDAVAIKSGPLNHGVATHLMQFALQLCADAGCRQVTVGENLTQRRSPFYEALGFQQQGWSFQFQ